MLSLSGIIGPILAAVIYTVWPGYAPIMFFAMFMSLVSYGLFWLYNRNHVVELVDSDPVDPVIDIV
jgi:hypothetical protein